MYHRRMESQAARAAARLKHDLGKAIRFTAPKTLEPETERLRERLSRDVLATRSGPEGGIPAWEVFEKWLARERALFPPGEPLYARLERLAAQVTQLRSLASRLPSSSRAELERLDGLTRSIAEDCRALAAEAAAPSREEP